jgi:hypothetical protein
VEDIRHALEKGTKVDVRDDFGWTALHHAAEAGREDIVEELLRRGAKSTITTSDGRTAKHLAEENGHDDIVRLINNPPTQTLDSVTEDDRFPELPDLGTKNIAPRGENWMIEAMFYSASGVTQRKFDVVEFLDRSDPWKKESASIQPPSKQLMEDSELRWFHIPVNNVSAIVHHIHSLANGLNRSTG